MTTFGYLDIPYAEVAKYMDDVSRKHGICKVLPTGRFDIAVDGARYSGLVCHPMQMGGEATGVGASACKNCILKED